MSDKWERRKSEVISLWDTENVMGYVAAALPRRLQWHLWNHILVLSSFTLHCLFWSWTPLGFFFSYAKWNKPVNFFFFFEEQCPVQYLRGWLWGKFQLIRFWLRLENSDILVTRLLWHQSSEAVTVFVASLLSFTLNNLYPAYTCQTSAPITFLCVILKISQFLTLEWVAENLAGSVSVLTLG